MIECGVRNELVLVKIPIFLVPNHLGHRHFVPFKYMSRKVYVSKMFLSILIIFCLSKLPSWLSNSQCLNHVLWNPQSTHWLVIQEKCSQISEIWVAESWNLKMFKIFFSVKILLWFFSLQYLFGDLCHSHWPHYLVTGQKLSQICEITI